jgi:hypothetical protein
MTERKPAGVDFSSWVDQQIIDAERRGAFDNLPGAGKPIPARGEEADFGQAWARDYARREGVPETDLLPAPLKLRREIERLTEAVQAMGSEQEVRDTVADLNRRIVEWRRIPLGPPVFVPLANEEMLVSQWREAHSVKRTAPLQADSVGHPEDRTADADSGRPPWWRSLRRRRRQ